MRLIDAEALKESVRKKYAALSDRCEINELVNAAPTIDAIPVEWMREKMYEADDAGDIDSVDFFSWIIQTWHKEQEIEELLMYSIIPKEANHENPT